MKVPKALDATMLFFPLGHVTLSAGLCSFNVMYAILFFYLAPVLIWRVLNSIYPTSLTGVSYLGKYASDGNLWYASHQLQWAFNAMPFFERMLLVVPGLYSAWLRLWGARIGKKVNWTCECKIVDRPLVHIGDRCLIGNRSYLSAHILKKKDNRYLLWVAPVTIGADCVLSYATTVAPGVVIDDGVFIEAGRGLYPKDHIKNESGRDHA